MNEITVKAPMGLLVVYLLVSCLPVFAGTCPSAIDGEIFNLEVVAEKLLQVRGVELNLDARQLPSIGQWDGKRIHVNPDALGSTKGAVAHEIVHSSTDRQISKNPTYTNLARYISFQTSKEFNLNYWMGEEILTKYKEYLRLDERHAHKTQSKVLEVLSKDHLKKGQWADSVEKIGEAKIAHRNSIMCAKATIRLFGLLKDYLNSDEYDSDFQLWAPSHLHEDVIEVSIRLKKDNQTDLSIKVPIHTPGLVRHERAIVKRELIGVVAEALFSTQKDLIHLEQSPVTSFEKMMGEIP